MPLDTPVRQCPFLLESDVVALLPGWSVAGTVLHDKPIGARHTIQPQGLPLLHAIAKGVRLSELYVLAAKHRLHSGDVRNLLGLLNALGALRRIRSGSLRIVAAKEQALQLLLGVRYAGLTWRKPATGRWLVVAVGRATWLVAAAAACTAGLLAGGGFLSFPAAFGTSAIMLGLFMSSLCIHEITHVTHILRHHHTPMLMQRGMRLGIVHPTLPRKDEVITALAGPAAGLTTCITAALVYWAADAPLYAMLCVAVGLFHIGSLLPWYGDGITIRRALRGRHA